MTSSLVVLTNVAAGRANRDDYICFWHIARVEPWGVGQPDRWEGVFNPIPKRLHKRHGTHWQTPIIVAWRGGDIVGLIQAIAETDGRTIWPAKPVAAGGAS